MPPVTRSRETADETRERIARVAEELFRRMGFAKTAVADIASELGMSPANVYRFFPSKTAIVQDICSRCLEEMEGEIRGICGHPRSPRQRIFDVFHAIMVYHRDNFLSERRVHDMVQVAIEENWEAIAAHKQRIGHALADLLIEGIEIGDFVPHDTTAASEILLGSMIKFCHPMLIAEYIDDDLEAQQRATLTFMLRSIEVNRTPI